MISPPLPSKESGIISQFHPSPDKLSCLLNCHRDIRWGGFDACIYALHHTYSVFFIRILMQDIERYVTFLVESAHLSLLSLLFSLNNPTPFLFQFIQKRLPRCISVCPGKLGRFPHLLFLRTTEKTVSVTARIILVFYQIFTQTSQNGI